MLAVEFNTTIDKPYIEIPNYEELKGHKVNVIVSDLEENKNTHSSISKKSFNPITCINTKNFKFDREFANER